MRNSNLNIKVFEYLRETGGKVLIGDGHIGMRHTGVLLVAEHAGRRDGLPALRRAHLLFLCAEHVRLQPRAARGHIVGFLCRQLAGLQRSLLLKPQHDCVKLPKAKLINILLRKGHSACNVK